MSALQLIGRVHIIIYDAHSRAVCQAQEGRIVALCTDDLHCDLEWFSSACAVKSGLSCCGDDRFRVVQQAHRRWLDLNWRKVV